jgi:transcriptional regulator with XRE-family HTH domain
MKPPSSPQPGAFADWLNATMQSRRLSQAQLARVVGVADTQVSRWRRGQVVPTVRYLQRIADTLDVPRASLDRLAGYPVSEASEEPPAAADPERQAELHAYSAAYRSLLEHEVPRALWRAYAEACAALAESMAGAHREAVRRSDRGVADEGQGEGKSRPAGFRP